MIDVLAAVGYLRLYWFPEGRMGPWVIAAVVVVAVVLAFVAAVTAQHKGRKFWHWMVAGLLLPTASVVVAFVLPDTRYRQMLEVVSLFQSGLISAEKLKEEKERLLG